MMMDYDELHTHPVNENLRSCLISSGAWNARRTKHNGLAKAGVRKEWELNRAKQIANNEWAMACKFAELKAQAANPRSIPQLQLQ